MTLPKRGYQGKYRFRLYDHENECHVDLTTDEVQVAFLLLERDKEKKLPERCKSCRWLKGHEEVTK